MVVVSHVLTILIYRPSVLLNIFCLLLLLPHIMQFCWFSDYSAQPIIQNSFFLINEPLVTLLFVNFFVFWLKLFSVVGVQL